MSIGSSGRIVIEIDPDLKRGLYSNLTAQGLTLKEWFVLQAEKFISNSNQWPKHEISIDGRGNKKTKK